MKRKLRIKSRLILLSMSVVFLLCLASGYIAMQGIYLYQVNEIVDNLSGAANETSLIIYQSIQSKQITGQDENLYKLNASFYAQEISNVYSLPVILFDKNLNVLETTFSDTDFLSYKAYASSVLESNSQAYVFTSINNSHYVVFYAPIIVNNTTLGVCVLFGSAEKIDRMYAQTFIWVLLSALGATAAAAAVHGIWYSRMIRPITQLVGYMKHATTDVAAPMEFTYRKHDEVKDLIDTCVTMVNRVNETVDETNYEKEKLDAIVTSMQDGVMTVDEYNNITRVNERIGDFFGAVNLFGHIPQIETIVAQVRETKSSVSTECAYNGKYYLLIGSPIRGALNDVLIVASDISAVKTFEAEQNKFISSVSHELRTPLTTVMGYIDMLMRRGTGDAALTEKALSTAKAETQRLLRLVNDLLNINRFNSTDFDFIFTDINPSQLIESVVVEMNVRGNPTGVTVVYTAVELPAIKGDYDRLKQVLLNVIDNAIKYSNEEDIVKVTATFDENELEITVRDFGDGIPDDKTDRIFDTFYRVEEDRNRSRGGFGLGLSIVKHIVEKHNGSVAVESMPQQGTLIIIRLPVIKAKEPLSDEEV